MNIDRMIWLKDTAGLARVIQCCNKILVSPLSGTMAKERAWSIKKNILFRTTTDIELDMDSKEA